MSLFTPFFDKLRASYRRWAWFIRSLFIKVDTGGIRWKYPLRIIPMINFFYDLFFDESQISNESCKALLDILGLLNALVLSGLFGVVASITYADSSAADAMWWGTGGPNPIPVNGTSWVGDPEGFLAAYPQATFPQRYWHKYYTNPPSTQLHIWVSNSLILFSIGVLVIVYVYADSVAKVSGDKKQEKKDEEESQARKTRIVYYCITDANNALDKNRIFDLLTKTDNERHDRATDQDVIAEVEDEEENEKKLYSAWWDYAKYAVFVCFFTTGSGVIYAILTCTMLFAIKYPDYYIMYTGDFSYTDIHCAIGHDTAFFFVAFAVCCGSCIFLCGFGTSARYSMEDSQREWSWFTDQLKQFLMLVQRMKENEAMTENEAGRKGRFTCGYPQFLEPEVGQGGDVPFMNKWEEADDKAYRRQEKADEYHDEAGNLSGDQLRDAMVRWAVDNGKSEAEAVEELKRLTKSELEVKESEFKDWALRDAVAAEQTAIQELEFLDMLKNDAQGFEARVKVLVRSVDFFISMQSWEQANNVIKVLKKLRSMPDLIRGADIKGIKGGWSRGTLTKEERSSFKKDHKLPFGEFVWRLYKGQVKLDIGDTDDARGGGETNFFSRQFKGFFSRQFKGTAKNDRAEELVESLFKVEYETGSRDPQNPRDADPMKPQPPKPLWDVEEFVRYKRHIARRTLFHNQLEEEHGTVKVVRTVKGKGGSMLTRKLSYAAVNIDHNTRLSTRLSQKVTTGQQSSPASSSTRPKKVATGEGGNGNV